MTRNDTALTTIDGGHGASGASAGRADAAFTAQLLAVRLDSPAFRQRRRIEPQLGVAAYRNRLAHTASRPIAPAQA